MILSPASALRAFNLIALLAACAVAIPTGQACAAGRERALTAFDGRAKALLSQMTLDEKVGQMCQPDQAFLKDPSDIGLFA
jgi:hypothetical protein